MAQTFISENNKVGIRTNMSRKLRKGTFIHPSGGGGGRISSPLPAIFK